MPDDWGNPPPPDAIPPGPPDPYRAPSAETAAREVVRYRVLPASAGRRFLGFVIDYAACFVLMTGIMFAIEIVADLAGIEIDLEESAGPGSGLVDRLLGAIFMGFYYLVFEGAFRRTPGKLVTGTIVVDQDGLRPSFGQIIGRTLARFIPLDPISYLGSSSRGWHDSISGTYVVRIRDRDEGRRRQT